MESLISLCETRAFRAFVVAKLTETWFLMISEYCFLFVWPFLVNRKVLSFDMYPKLLNYSSLLIANNYHGLSR